MAFSGFATIRVGNGVPQRLDRRKGRVWMVSLSSWVRARIDLEQALGIDLGIDLRGRERGVTEQFLDRAQIPAAGEQVRGKRVPQRMRCRRIRKTERSAQPFHDELDD